MDRRGAPEAAQRHGAAQREGRVGGDAQEELFVGGPGDGLCCHLLLAFAAAMASSELCVQRAVVQRAVCSATRAM